ncbi:WD40 repeat [Nonomuraea solani]|uniref:WD40 repeat n=1 Tax=Nonomuraea solani TaxID=1144553 RepID=A0A1H6ESQ2_9ACTN|nr:WD40 repeat domain-containing serine/threonine-protein kinase [Nonomuraea solani]SEG99985.1 WD40 repeat [Nonomuraea solani]
MARLPLAAQDPARVGDYRLEGRLGSDVFEGRDSSGGRVVIKLLRDPPRSGVAGSSFPCTARVLACGVHDGRPYVVTEYVDGPSLGAVVAAYGPLTGDDLHRLAAGTATALTALHEAGIVHGALGPRKVLLGLDGPRVIDVAQPAGPLDHDQAGDVRAWGALVRFAATGAHEAGANEDLPPGLRSLVAAALSEKPPGARELLLHLVAPNESARGDLLAKAEERARGPHSPLILQPMRPAPIRRRSIVVTALVVLLLAAAAGLVIRNAYAERDRATAERDLALGRELIARSETLAVAEPRLARLLAVAAARISPDGMDRHAAETRAAVRAATARPQLAVLGGFSGEAHSVAFSPDGAHLVASGDGEPLRMWDLTRLAPVKWPVDGERTGGGAVAYSRDGRHLAVAGADGRVRVWDTATRRQWTEGERTASARRWTAFSPDGRLLVTAGGESRLWDTVSGAPLATLRSSEGDPGPVAFSPDGAFIAAAYPGGPIRTFEVATGRLTGDPLRPAAGTVAPEPGEKAAALAFSPDGTLIAGTTGSERVQLWDVATRRPARRPLTGHTGLVTSAAFSPDGEVLATASQDRTIRLWDVRTGRPLGEPLTGHTQVAGAVAFSPDGAVLASASADTTVRLWQVPRGIRHRLTLPGPDGVGEVPADRPRPARWYERPDTSQAVLSADASRLVVQPYDTGRPGVGRLWSWDVRSGHWLGERVPIRRDAPVDGLAVSPDGRSLAASGDGNTTILNGPATVRGRPLAYNHDATLLATTGPDKAVRLWTLPDGKAKGPPLTGHAAEVAAFSPDGALLAAGAADGSVVVWDVATGRRRGVLRGHTGRITSLAFAGNLLVSGSGDRSARLWDAAAARPHAVPLTGHTGPVQAVAFGPDGGVVATASRDRTVRLWDTATGRPLGPPLAGHGGAVGALAFAGARLVAVAADLVQVTGDSYAVWEWDTTALTQDATTLACAQAARALTPREWAAYVPGLPFREVCR